MICGQHTVGTIFNPIVMWYNDGASVAGTDTTPLTTDREGSSKMAACDLDRPACVYKVTNLVNGKAYIGVTAFSVDARWKQHKRTRAKNRFYGTLQMAIRKYGADAFSVTTLCKVATVREARDIERAMIVEHQTMSPKGYNLTSGGEGSVGRVISAEVRKATSAAVKALWDDPVYRERQISTFQTRELPQSHIEHLRRQAAAMKGKPRKPESIEKGRAKLMGHSVSAETRAKISAAGKGKHAWTDERKAHHSEALRRRHAEGVYQENNKRLSKNKKAWWAAQKAQTNWTGQKEFAFISESKK